MRRLYLSFLRIVRRPARRRRRRAVGVAAYRARKEEARLLVRARLAYWRSVHPFEHGMVRIKNQRRAWGSCSSKRNLNFNWRLVALPPELADYVILHELCHTVHFNHSADFWALLTSLAPEAMSHRGRLQAIPMSRLG
jgi:hypothetical protein